MDWSLIQGVFTPYTLFLLDKFQIHHNFEKDKVLSKDE